MYNEGAKGTIINLHQYQDSANFIFGLVNNSIDLFDNPYIKFAAYEVDQDNKMEKVDLKRCEEQDLLKMMSKEIVHYYPNSLCFKNRSQVIIENNWFDKKWKGVYWTVEECV